MAEILAQIPDRDVFKASEVCEIAQVQPYVLRSWEQEFPNLGTARSAGGARIYRRADVERVLRIKQLVFGEGLTLAGVRKRLDGEPVVVVAEDNLPELLDDGARARLTEIKRELRSLLDMLEEPVAVVGAQTAAEPEAEQPTLLDVSEGATPWPSKPAAKRKGTGRSRPSKTADGSES